VYVCECDRDGSALGDLQGLTRERMENRHDDVTPPCTRSGSTSRYPPRNARTLKGAVQTSMRRGGRNAAPGVKTAALALRLALAKAPRCWPHGNKSSVIGSDQVADLDGSPIGKPAITNVRANSSAR
jgi:septum formation protein